MIRAIFVIGGLALAVCVTRALMLFARIEDHRARGWAFAALLLAGGLAALTVWAGAREAWYDAPRRRR